MVTAYTILSWPEEVRHIYFLGHIKENPTVDKAVYRNIRKKLDECIKDEDFVIKDMEEEDMLFYDEFNESRDYDMYYDDHYDREDSFDAMDDFDF